jgi:hypothetical protein
MIETNLEQTRRQNREPESRQKWPKMPFLATPREGKRKIDKNLKEEYIL